MTSSFIHDNLTYHLLQRWITGSCLTLVFHFWGSHTHFVPALQQPGTDFCTAHSDWTQRHWLLRTFIVLYRCAVLTRHIHTFPKLNWDKSLSPTHLKLFLFSRMPGRILVWYVFLTFQTTPHQTNDRKKFKTRFLKVKVCFIFFINHTNCCVGVSGRIFTECLSFLWRRLLGRNGLHLPDWWFSVGIRIQPRDIIYNQNEGREFILSVLSKLTHLRQFVKGYIWEFILKCIHKLYVICPSTDILRENI